MAFAFVMAVLPHPPQIPGDPDDKVQHIIAFTALGVLAASGYRRTPVWQLLLGLAAFGAVIEVVQAIPLLHRDSDILDWVADIVAAGAVLGLAGGLRLLRRRARRRRR